MQYATIQIMCICFEKVCWHRTFLSIKNWCIQQYKEPKKTDLSVVTAAFGWGIHQNDPFDWNNKICWASHSVVAAASVAVVDVAASAAVSVAAAAGGSHCCLLRCCSSLSDYVEHPCCLLTRNTEIIAISKHIMDNWCSYRKDENEIQKANWIGWIEKQIFQSFIEYPDINNEIRKVKTSNISLIIYS